jgi:hypothetical protein
MTMTRNHFDACEPRKPVEIRAPSPVSQGGLREDLPRHKCLHHVCVKRLAWTSLVSLGPVDEFMASAYGCLFDQHPEGRADAH